MREILFRGKRPNGQWVQGDLTLFRIDEEVISKISFHQTRATLNGWRTATYTNEVIPETVGQFTGLTDKNGTKIFEGDIVKFGINQRLMYVHWNEETLTWELTDIGVPACEVNHLSNTFDLGEIQVESAYGEMFSEVIGNIHDNPELLEKV